MANNERAKKNRDNAAKSTGPKTEAGKAKARHNAVSHGMRSLTPVLPNEKPKEWETHRDGIIESLAPAGRLEEELAERVALCLWRLRRVMAYETGVVANDLANATDAHQGDEHDAIPLSIRPRDYGLDEARAAIGRNQTDLHGARRALRDFAALREKKEDESIDGSAVVRMLDEINCVLPGEEEDYFDTDDKEFVSALGIPASYSDRLDEWGGWTVSKLRQAVALIAAEFKTAPETLLADAERNRAEGLANLQAEGVQLQEEVRRRERIAGRKQARKVCKALLPDEATMERIMRYEAHLGRQLLQALHTLERLQKARDGQDVPAPAALDVTVSS
jgi:hypothetical protein